MSTNLHEHATEAKPSAPAAPSKRKRVLMLGGGVAGVLSLAFTLALAAVPDRSRARSTPPLEGPFVARLSSSEVQVNLAGEGSKRYLVMALNAEYFVYDQAYVVGRLALPPDPARSKGDPTPEDPLYTARLKDALLRIATTKTRDQVTDPGLADAFMEEMRQAVDPILFPIYVGDSRSLATPDSQSGVRGSESVAKSTLSGLLHEHVLHVDGPRGTIALDDGEPVAFTGSERDARLTNRSGECVFVDLTRCKPQFAGDVPVGRPGRVTQLYRESFLIQ